MVFFYHLRMLSPRYHLLRIYSCFQCFYWRCNSVPFGILWFADTHFTLTKTRSCQTCPVFPRQVRVNNQHGYCLLDCIGHRYLLHADGYSSDPAVHEFTPLLHPLI